MEAPREAHENSRNTEHQNHVVTSHAIDYRFQPAEQSEVRIQIASDPLKLNRIILALHWTNFH